MTPSFYKAPRTAGRRLPEGSVFFVFLYLCLYTIIYYLTLCLRSILPDVRARISKEIELIFRVSAKITTTAI